MWFVVCVEGFGMGWVLLFDVDVVCMLLWMFDGVKLIVVLCVGYVDVFYVKLMFEEECWVVWMLIEVCLFENGWDVLVVIDGVDLVVLFVGLDSEMKYILDVMFDWLFECIV